MPLNALQTLSVSVKWSLSRSRCHVSYVAITWMPCSGEASLKVQDASRQVHHQRLSSPPPLPLYEKILTGFLRFTWTPWAVQRGGRSRVRTPGPPGQLCRWMGVELMAMRCQLRRGEYLTSMMTANSSNSATGLHHITVTSPTDWQTSNVLWRAAETPAALWIEMWSALLSTLCCCCCCCISFADYSYKSD